MTKREGGRPPLLQGYEPIELIGSGGFADVFLCRQLMPDRQVAVKVVSRDALSRSVGDFAAEANLMAKVRHPYIVQVLDVRVADDGRPCLVMEYYPGENYDQRARRERFSVADVLRTGVRLAAAVETAHRAGILHRDIKPANILTNEFQHPGLTDFGIASAGGSERGEEGVSPPWAPPEAFGDAPLDVRSDVYSLAATLYHLLTGRSPFEVAGGDNRAEALIARIETLPVPSTGLSEVPDSLERVLSGAMAKSPSHRPATAEAFGRQLQRIELEMKLVQTVLELADTGPTPRARLTTDDDATRVKGVRQIEAQPSVAAQPGPARIDHVPARPGRTNEAPLPEREREGVLAAPAVAETEHKVRPQTKPDDVVATSRRYPVPVPVMIGAAVLVAAIAVVPLVSRDGDDGREQEVPSDLAVNDGLADAGDVLVPPPAPSEFTASATSAGWRYEWKAVEGAVGYDVTEDGGAAPTRVEVTVYETSATCIEVEAIGENGLISAPTRGCAG